MSTTWGNIKLIALQKMFAADGTSIPNDTSTVDYIASMPGAANEALQLIATAGKFIKKTIAIAHNPVDNLLSNGDHIHSMERGTITFEADAARSMYFEYYGTGTYSVTVAGVELLSGSLSSTQKYTEFRKLIPNVGDAKVVLTFTSSYPFAVKNVALYSADFPTDDDVQTFAEKVRYKLTDLADDFYLLDEASLIYEGDADVSRYTQTSDYFQEGNTVLLLDRDTPGNFIVQYKAYPPAITTSTADDYELSLDDEVVPLIPLYIASQLYKDDDNGIATTYRNEFEVAFSRLKDTITPPSLERFTSESGWI